MEKVLVLYNHFNENDATFQESRSGVMDQVNAVAGSLKKLGIESDVLAVRDLRHLTEILANRSEKLVFNLIEEFSGSIREACMAPALCEAFGAGFTGNGTEALVLAQDKARAKAILMSAGLLCPAGISIKPGDSLKKGDLKKGTYIIKPSCCDASEGIEADSVVTVPSAAADEKIRWIHEKFNQAAVVEQFIPARELNVSVIETENGPKVLPLAEIDFSAFSKKQLRLVDYQAKWVKDSFGYNNTPRIIPAPLAELVAEKVRTIAKQAWETLGCSGYARVDFRLDEKDSPFVLEVNPNPDISPDAGLAAALVAAEIPYEQFVLMMLNNAVRRRDLVTRIEPQVITGVVSSYTDDNKGRESRVSRPEIRPAEPSDETEVLDIIERTGFFRPAEIEIAKEVFEDAALKKPGCSYQSYVAQINGKVAGWVCFGETPCTLGTFDIYWIAVDPDLHRQGVGKLMLKFSEESIVKQGGRLAVVETSGMSRYEPTQKFYLKSGYSLAANIPDFYAPQDSKLVFLKILR